MTKNSNKESWLSVAFIGIAAVICFLPFWIAVIASFTPETEITTVGYHLWPNEISLDTYKFIFNQKGSLLLRAYGMSIVSTVLGTAYSMFIMLTYSYAISQKKEVFPLSRALSFFAWFTTVFSGGTLPWYILCTKYYGLQNNLWALFVPYGMNVFNMFILRNTFKSIPHELYEAARIDGASNGKIFVQIALPLAKVGMATVGLFTAIGLWNDYYLSLYLISQQKMYTLQRLLYQMTSNLQSLYSGLTASTTTHFVPPQNTAKMAVMVLTITPILLVYPSVQKYFVRGITIGAVKG